MAKHDKKASAAAASADRAPGPAAGPATLQRGAPRVSVTGVGRVERAADIAQATFVVEGIRDTAAEARSVAAAAAAAVLGAIAGAGVAASDVRTAGLDVLPNWEHEGNRSVRKGFTVTNRIAATVRDLELVGTVLDAALEAGATGLDGVSFLLADQGPAASEARALAVADARARAGTIAAAAGLRLGALVGIVEGSTSMPMARRESHMVAMSMDTTASTPVVPGSIEVSVSVSAEWELTEG